MRLGHAANVSKARNKMNLLFYILAFIVVLVGLLYCFVLVYKLDQRINKKKFDKLRERGLK